MAARLRVGIAGAGVLGRLLAWRLQHLECDVTVYDPATGPSSPATGHLLGADVPYAAGFTAAGMLSPLAELDNAGLEIARLGWRSLAQWRRLTDCLQTHCAVSLFTQNGSLLLAHGSDVGAARRVLHRLQAVSVHAEKWPQPEPVFDDALLKLEPGLRPGLHGWYLPQEAQILPRETLVAMVQEASSVDWAWGRHVSHVEPGRLVLADGETRLFDLTIDVRGVGARPDLPLRGVRGELIWLHAPNVSLQRPIRLLHARHRVYIVPRPGNHFVVGASEIESEDRSPVSLKSAVELMAAAQSVLPALAESRIVHMEANLRPALPNNHPLIEHQPGLLRINGLFRHGWLLAPALVDDAIASLGWTSGDNVAVEEMIHE